MPKKPHALLPVQSHLYCRPVFAVNDIQASLLYYLSALDFQHDWSVPPDAAVPIAVQVSRGTAQILLWTEPTLATPGRVYISLEHEHELEALHLELQARRAHIVSPPAPRLWGPLGFIVEDLDQNQLYFVGQPPRSNPV